MHDEAWVRRLALHAMQSALLPEQHGHAMHAQAKLDAHDTGQLLFYVPAVDRPAARLAKPDFDEMRAEANIGATAKMPGLLPLFVGMEAILTEWCQRCPCMNVMWKATAGVADWLE